MPPKKQLLNHAQAVPAYSDILRSPTKAPTKNTEKTPEPKDPKRSKAYHLREGTINAIADRSIKLQVPIGDFVDFLLSEGLKALEEGRLDLPVKQGKKKIVLS